MYTSGEEDQESPKKVAKNRQRKKVPLLALPINKMLAFLFCQAEFAILFKELHPKRRKIPINL